MTTMPIAHFLAMLEELLPAVISFVAAPIIPILIVILIGRSLIDLLGYGQTRTVQRMYTSSIIVLCIAAFAILFKYPLVDYGWRIGVICAASILFGIGYTLQIRRSAYFRRFALGAMIIVGILVGVLEHKQRNTCTFPSDFDGGDVVVRHNGVNHAWYKNGQMKHEEKYRNCEPYGIHRAWYESGQLRHQAQYIQGGKTIILKIWNEKGQLIEVSRDNRRSGESVTSKSRVLYKNGKKESEYISKYEGVSDDGTWWYDKGNGMSDDGTWWYGSGTLSFMPYHSNSYTILQREWYDNGQKKYEEVSQYAKGEGYRKTVLYKSTQYDDGNIKEEWIYNRDGSLKTHTIYNIQRYDRERERVRALEEANE